MLYAIAMQKAIRIKHKTRMLTEILKILEERYSKYVKKAKHRGHSVKRGFLFFTIERPFTSQLEVKAPNGILKKPIFGLRFTKKTYLKSQLLINTRRKLNKKPAERHSSCSYEASYIYKLF